MVLLRDQNNFMGIMKRSFLSLLFFGFISCATSQVELKSYQDIPVEDLEFSYPKISSYELSNGLKIFYKPDHELPFVTVKLYLPGGHLYESRDKLGYFDFLGKMIRDGGIEGVRLEDVDIKLESIGAAIESGYTADYGTIAFNCLKEDLPEVSKLFKQFVRSPAFNPARLEVLKSIKLESIKRRGENPDVVAGIMSNKAIYGEDSDYSTLQSVESIKKLNVKELKELYHLYSRPNGSYVGISGDLSEEEIKNLTQDLFADWPRSEQQLEKKKIAPEFNPEGGKFTSWATEQNKSSIRPRIYLLNRSLQQSTVQISHLGLKRDLADRYIINLYGESYSGGNFSSLFFQRIRTQLGLVYGIFGGFSPDQDIGEYNVMFQTRNSKVGEAIKETLNLIQATREMVIPSDQLELVTTGIKNGFVFRFASSANQVNRAIIKEIYNYEKDFDEKFFERLSAISGENIRDFSAKNINPSQFSIVVVGGTSVDQLRSELGANFDYYTFEFDDEVKNVKKVN